jgi:hypothetical protein
VTGAFKFLAAGAVSPFTDFCWPEDGTWVSAPRERHASWVYACRKRDLPYWVAAELWRIELDGPIDEGSYQISAPVARLAGRIEAWDDGLRRLYAHACAMHARELALPVLPPDLQERVAGTEEPDVIAAAVRSTSGAPATAGYVADAAGYVDAQSPAAASYIACVVAASLGEGQRAFEAERAWQARWLSEHLGLNGA